MARILTGVQSTGVPHLGNLLGAILPAVELSKKEENETFLFIANMHTLTAVKDAEQIREFTYSVAATWLACGFDTDKNVFYRQSDVPEVTELTWYLNCFTPLPMLQNAHSFKDKADRVEKVNAGLFTYPVLMAADILLYDAEIVPVGKDQKQHLEITRDIAGSINHIYGKDIFVLPEAQLDEKVMIVPGIDGQKMSKSYGNYINIFLEDKPLRKNVMKIVTDSTPLEEPKDPDSCNVYNLYKLVASEEQIAEMRQNYLNGGYGYGHAKQELYEQLVRRFQPIREAYWAYMDDREMLDKALQIGADKAREVASTTLQRVRETMGY
jgi:tryptophanyl-tRNA synthetase